MNTHSNRKRQIISAAYVLIAGILWGTIGLFVRSLAGFNLSSLEIAALRSLSVAVTLSVFLFFYNKKLLIIKIKDLWCFIGTGVISLTSFNICYFSTISMTSLAVAATLLYTAPAFVMVLSFFIFKESLGVGKIIAVVMAFVGCVFVTGVISDGAALRPAGILLGLGSGIGYALYTIFGRFALNRGYDSLTITFYTVLCSSVSTLPLLDFRKLAQMEMHDPELVVIVFFMGLICTALPYFFYNKGLIGLEGGQASVIASIEPVAATIIGVLVFKESPAAMTIIGMTLVIGSIIIVNIKTGK